MDTPRNRPARWTQADTSGCPDRDDGLITLVARTLYNKPTRHQTGAVDSCCMALILPQSKRQTSLEPKAAGPAWGCSQARRPESTHRCCQPSRDSGGTKEGRHSWDAEG